MPIGFRFPRHIKEQIAEKMQPVDFVNFKMTSRLAAHVKPRRPIVVHKMLLELIPGNNVRLYFGSLKRFTSFFYYLRHQNTMIKDGAFRVKFENLVLSETASEKYCGFLVSFFMKTKFTFAKLQLRGRISFTSPTFEKLLKVGQCSGIQTDYVRQSVEFFQSETIQRIRNLFVNVPFGEDEVLMLQASHIFLYYENLTEFLLNKIIKQWLSGARTISFVSMFANQPLHPAIVFEGITFEEVKRSEEYKVKRVLNGMQESLDVFLGVGTPVIHWYHTIS